MKDSKPILFTAEEVRATLEGRKTQKRFIVKLPKSKNLVYRFDGAWKDGGDSEFCPNYEYLHVPFRHVAENDFSEGTLWRLFCPYGEPGTKLWVKETFTTYRAKTAEEEARTKEVLAKFERGEAIDIIQQALSLPKATGPLKVLYAADYGDWAYNKDADLGPWKPSIFMPGWASRITLEIVSIKVERVQEISEEDAKAEGVHMPDGIKETPEGWSYKQEYQYLWERINGPESWNENPWCWVINFRQLTPTRE